MSIFADLKNEKLSLCAVKNTPALYCSGMIFEQDINEYPEMEAYILSTSDCKDYLFSNHYPYGNIFKGSILMPKGVVRKGETINETEINFCNEEEYPFAFIGRDINLPVTTKMSLPQFINQMNGGSEQALLYKDNCTRICISDISELNNISIDTVHLFY